VESSGAGKFDVSVAVALGGPERPEQPEEPRPETDELDLTGRSWAGAEELGARPGAVPHRVQ